MGRALQGTGPGSGSATGGWKGLCPVLPGLCRPGIPSEHGNNASLNSSGVHCRVPPPSNGLYPPGIPAQHQTASPGHPRPAPNCIPRAAPAVTHRLPPSPPSRARSPPAVPCCGGGGAGYGRLGSPIPAALPVPLPEAAPAAVSAAHPHGHCALGARRRALNSPRARWVSESCRRRAAAGGVTPGTTAPSVPRAARGQRVPPVRAGSDGDGPTGSVPSVMRMRPSSQ